MAHESDDPFSCLPLESPSSPATTTTRAEAATSTALSPHDEAVAIEATTYPHPNPLEASPSPHSASATLAPPIPYPVTAAPHHSTMAHHLPPRPSMAAESGRAVAGARIRMGMSHHLGSSVAASEGAMGPNHTFMQMINALALEEQQHGISDGEEDELGRETTTTTDDEEQISNERPQRAPLAPSSISSPLRRSIIMDNDMAASSPSLNDSFSAAAAASDEDDDEAYEAEGLAAAGAGAEGVDLLASSLHALHRPIAARRRAMTGERGEIALGGIYAQARVAEAVDLAGTGATAAVGSENVASSGDGVGGRAVLRRTTTGLSVVRKMRLAQKLEEIFQLDEAEDVVAEFPCWLFRSVLLQGYIYLTTGHICFYAYLSRNEGKILRSGSLSARGTRTRVYHKHWFILKDAVLSWYPSSTDPYFPDGHVDLHYCTAVESSAKHAHHFKVSTAEHKWHFSADSEASRDEWVKLIKKVVFRAQNEGESVKIAIPLETIVDIERSSSLEFAETIRIRVYDADEGYSLDEYWLSYFSDLEGALQKMTMILDQFRLEHPDQARQAASVVDTTAKVFPLLQPPQASSSPSSASPPSTTAHSRSGSFCPTLSSRPRLAPLAGLSTISNAASSSSSSSSPISTTSPRRTTSLSSRLGFGQHQSIDRSTSSLTTLRDTKQGSSPTTPRASAEFDRPSSPSSGLSAPPSLPSFANDTYPPDPVPLSAQSQSLQQQQHGSSAISSRSSSSWTIPSLPTVSNWLKGGAGPPKRFLASSGAMAVTASASATSFVGAPVRKIIEVVSGSGGLSMPQEEGARGAEFVVEGEEEADAEMGTEGSEKLRMAFGLGEKEFVVAEYHAYLFRGLPIYGKVYISTAFFCFKSVGILARTKMILPLSDIIAVSKHRSYRIGYSGLIVVIKGHEEIFFELNSSDRRDRCMRDLESQLDLVHARDSSISDDLLFASEPTTDRQDHLDLLDLARSHSSSSTADQEQRPPPETLSSSQPPTMFCSTSSDFVTFRPEKSLRFTCLTIGSRGDVQPYIALCKGLMAEGHTCKIASHGEYRDWVEGHGILFEEVGGDPAELMQLMIAHDFFTISFMKEAIGRFRGWLDDLLETTWTACQGTDVLIESPSAIAGLHIAEALRIPYFRAFTMPWSRTRAYPHAFAVPDHKMGGGYNYMTYTMFDQIFWRATAGQVNRWRKKTLGLRSTSLETMAQHKIPFLYNFSPVIVPPPLDWRENIHVTGYWVLDNPDDSVQQKWQPPAELLTFLDLAKEQQKKIVFIGFGSIIIPDPEEMTRVITAAVERSGVFAIIAKGWSDRAAATKDASVDPILEQSKKEDQERKEAAMMKRPYIFNIKSIPHDWLFPRIDAAVHHGGAGTTGASLRAGLPTIIKPFFGDQYFYADRVATLGIGSAVRDMTVEHLAAAITLAVTDEKQIARAKLAGETIRKEDGVGQAIECIYRDLEYSRSLLTAIKDSRLPEVAPIPTPTTNDSDPNLASASLPARSIPSPRRRRSLCHRSRSSESQSPSMQRSGTGGADARNDADSSDESSWDVISARGSERDHSMI